MSYALPEKQKEYQREWAKKKRAKFNKEITWEKLTRTEHKDIKCLKTWKLCVSKARGLFVGVDESRMKVASIALRACVIKHGGDMRTDRAKQELIPNTLMTFAKEIGMSYKTLHTWVRVKELIYDELPEEIKKTGMSFKHANAAMAEMRAGLEADGAKAYNKQTLKPAKRQKAERIFGYVRHIETVLALHGTSGFTEDEIKKVKHRLKKILEYF